MEKLDLDISTQTVHTDSAPCFWLVVALVAHIYLSTATTMATSGHHFGPDSNASTAIGQNAVNVFMMIP